MFRYFPKNYVWNLSVDLSIEMGARIGEIEEMCAPLLAASEHPDAEGTRAFRETWSRMADKLCALAGEDEARGRRLSAGEVSPGGQLLPDLRAPAGAWRAGPRCAVPPLSRCLCHRAAPYPCQLSAGDYPLRG